MMRKSIFVKQKTQVRLCKIRVRDGKEGFLFVWVESFKAENNLFHVWKAKSLSDADWLIIGEPNAKH